MRIRNIKDTEKWICCSECAADAEKVIQTEEDKLLLCQDCFDKLVIKMINRVIE